MQQSSKNYVWFEDMESYLGGGSYGAVFKGKDRATGKAVAVKVCQLPICDASEIYIEDVNLLKTFRSPYITEYYAAEEVNGSITRRAIVMELADGTLASELEKEANRSGIPKREFFVLVANCVGALEYLHINNLCHRDVKPHNVLIFRRNEESSSTALLVPKMPDYKLTYFNFRGLGEGARLLFHYAGVPYQDIRLEMQEWPKLKPSAPFGQVPLLEVDGQVISQSAAINRYLGRKFGLVPKDPIAEALVDSVFDAHKDFFSEVKPFFCVAAGFQQGDKAQLVKDVYLPARDKYFCALKRFLQKSGGEFLVSKEVSWADIVIADHIATFASLVPETFVGFPEVKRFVDNVLRLPPVAKWISERPKTPF